MKPLDFKKLLCVMLSASILFPSVARAGDRPGVPPVPGKSSSESSEFMKKNWPYFAAGIPGVAIIAGVAGYAFIHASKNKQPGSSNICRTEEEWAAYVKYYTDIGKLPGAVVFRYENNYGMKPYYFYVITNSEEFNRYLSDGCHLSTNPKAISLVKQWANKIIFDKDAYMAGDASYDHVFIGKAGRFSDDLFNATKVLNADAEKKFTGNASALPSAHISECMSENFKSYKMNMIQNNGGIKALSDTALQYFINAQEGSRVTPDDMEIMKTSVEQNPQKESITNLAVPTGTAGQTTTTTTTTTAEAGSELHGQPHVLGKKQEPLDAAHGYTHGLRFYRCEVPSQWEDAVAKKLGRGPLGNFLGVAVRRLEKGVSTLTRNDRLCTRHGYIVENVQEFINWCKSLYDSSDNPWKSQEECEQFIHRVLRHQNRWMSMPSMEQGRFEIKGALTDGDVAAANALKVTSAVTNVGAKLVQGSGNWNLGSVFGQPLDFLLGDMWGSEITEARKKYTTVEREISNQESGWGTLMFNRDDDRVSYIRDKDKIGGLFNLSLTSEADLKDKLNWSDYDNAYGLEAGTVEGLVNSIFGGAAPSPQAEGGSLN